MLNKINQVKMDLGIYSGLYDILIEKDNFWRQINECVDLSFVVEKIQQNYSVTMGRSAEDPVKLLKYILLKTAYKLSDRNLINRTRTRMQMKYFLDYVPEDNLLIQVLPSSFTVKKLKCI